MVTTTINQPNNLSLLQSSKYTLTLSIIPHVTYFLQTCNLPGASVNEAIRETPFATQWLAGDKLIYNPLNITFLMDEDLRAWNEIYQWQVGLTFPENFDQYKKMLRDNDNQRYSEAILTLNTNANNPNIRYKFTDVFPIILGDIDFDVGTDATQPLVATAAFRYSTMSIERL